jgi:predicted glycosyltransferase
MKILIDISHSPDVYFFRHAIGEWQKRGHEICIAARDQDIIFDLLEAHKLPYLSMGKAGRGLIGLAWELVRHESRVWQVMRSFQPDIVLEFGGTFVVHAAFLTRTPSIMFTDTEHAIIANSITFPFASVICTPSCFRLDLGAKQVRFDGFKELAYLHPRYFEPNVSVLSKLGLSPGEPYTLIRLVYWGSAHDLGQRGFDVHELREFIAQLSKHGRVFLSFEDEDAVPPDLEPFRLHFAPEKIHHLMAFARLYVGEGATMATEAGLLGTPSIYVSSLVGTMGNFDELMNKYKLVYAFRKPQEAMELAMTLLRNGNAKQEWQVRRDRLLRDKIDVTQFMVEFVENYPDSFYAFQRTHRV